MFQVFNAEVEGNSNFAKSITLIGPRVRFNPFRNSSFFTVQSSAKQSFSLFTVLPDNNDLKYLIPAFY